MIPYAPRPLRVTDPADRHRAARRRAGRLARSTAAVLLVSTAVVSSTAIIDSPVGAATGDLVMVTGTGDVSDGEDAAKQALFESWGWSVSIIDDSSSSGTYAAAAAAGDVFFVSDTAVTGATVVRDLDVGVVVEDADSWAAMLFAAAGSPVRDTATEIDVVATSHHVTSPFGVGALPIHTSPEDVTAWDSGTWALPTGVVTLARPSGSSDRDALIVAEQGAALHGGNTAAARRVWFPSDGVPVGVFLADQETLLERSLEWVARLETSVVVNATGTAGDANPGDGVCDTGGTNSAGDDACTLRAAIDEANASAGIDTVRFSMPVTEPGHAAGVWTITPTTALVVDEPVTIDATTQPGHATTPVVELVGSGAPGGSDGILFDFVGGTVRGLAIGGFPANGVHARSGGAVTIERSHLGVDASGTVARPNGGSGVYLDDADASVIGGAGAGNVISGNALRGVRVEFSDGVVIAGNIIGLDASGVSAMGNDRGITVDSSVGVVIGGAAPGAGNVVSGNTDIGVAVSGDIATIEGNRIGTDATGATAIGNAGHGIWLDFTPGTSIVDNTIAGNAGDGVYARTSDDLVVQGNRIGTDIAALQALPNTGDGLDLDGTNLRIGGAAPGDGNVVSGNGANGISLVWTVDVVIEGNTIGANTVGGDLGNGGHGVWLADPSEGAVVGGTSPATANRIAFNGLDGVSVPMSNWGDVVAVVGNSIHSNGGIGIDLGNNGPNVNDPGDGDGAVPNDSLNHPVITSAAVAATTLTVDYTLDVPAGSYRIEFFDDVVADPGGYGEGRSFLGATTVVHPGGSQVYAASVDAGGGAVASATATSLSSGEPLVTSEFAPAVPIVGIACGDTDTDGLCDADEDADADADGNPTTSAGPDTDGDSLANFVDADDDGDGIPTASEHADPNADGDPRDALDTDRDGQADWLDVEAGASGLPIADEQRISASSGGLSGSWDPGDWAGTDVAAIGDLDGDGVVDVAVGANGDDDGGTNRGAVWVLFLNADGTVRAEQKISDLSGGLAAALDDFDQFGSSVAGVGDLDGDGLGEVAVGARFDDDGGADRGAVWVLFLNADGTVRAEQKISDLSGGLSAALDDDDQFGFEVAGLGDLDGDGLGDLAVGAWGDDDGGSDRGAVHVLFLADDATVVAEQKISDLSGGLVATIPNGSNFGVGLAGIGDLDGDGVTDLAVGAWNDDDGGSDRGAVYVLRLEADGTVSGEQKLSATSGGFGGTLDALDDFGSDVAGPGDIDGDGTPDLVVGAPRDDDGGSGRGALWLLTLNPDGTVDSTAKISSTDGGLTGPLADGDQFGYSVHGLGDLDRDGTLDLLAGAWAADDGGADAGAVYVLDLTVAVPPGTVVVNSTGDAIDSTAGDGLCRTGATNGEGEPECTLRAAIQEANASATIDTIHFDIPVSDPGHGAGVWTIALLGGTALQVSAPTTIDATTQPGYVAPGGSFPGAVDGRPAVRIDRGAGSTILHGLWFDPAADDSVVRGISITGFTGAGASAIRVDGVDGVDVVGNWLGVAPDETVDGNQVGVQVGNGATDTTIGSAPPADRNRIVGSVYGAVTVHGSTTAGTVVKGNDLVQAGAFGVVLWGGTSDNLIGGTAPGEGNRILDSWKGVLVDSNAVDSFATILGNHIGNSTAAGIDLLNDGTTANDVGDVDTGPNDLLNFPVITAADVATGTVDLEVELDVPAGPYRIEVFANPSGAGPSGHGEGEQFVHAFTVTHTGSGTETFTTSFAGAAGATLSATATEDVGGGGFGGGGFGSTSEFSAVFTACGDADADGLCDHLEDLFGDTDGDSSLNRDDPDDDGDGVPTASEHADPNGDGDPRDARDADRDGQPDWLDRPTPPTAVEVVQEQRIGSGVGGLTAVVDDGDEFGRGVVSIGDLDRDGIVDVAVGAPMDDDGGSDRGAVYVVFLHADGTVRAEQKISDLTGGLAAALDDGDRFGSSVAAPGDIDGDGTPDLVVGAQRDDDGGSDRGAVYVLFLHADGTVRAEQKISDLTGGLVAALGNSDFFGLASTGLGDVDGDGVPDIAAGAFLADDGGADRGAVYVLFLEPDGTVADEQKISDTSGGLAATLDDGDWFGISVGSPGDLDGDGVPDLLAGAHGDDDGGPDRGASYVVFLNADGTVRDEQKISDTSGGLAATLDDGDEFGFSLAGVGDLDGDGVGDVVVGAPRDDDGGTDRGAVHVLVLNADGTVRVEQKISDSVGGVSAILLDDGDRFGSSAGGVGDLDGDGSIGLVIGGAGDDVGGVDRGAAYVLDLGIPGAVVVNSTGDAGDQNVGDGVCRTGATNSEGAPECTLRAAIQEANASTPIDTIHFDIPVSDPEHVAGTWTIRPSVASPLPALDQSVTIDATTQPGAIVNTSVAPAPMNGHLAIELSGEADDVTLDWDGLVLNAGSSGSVIRGISFVEWDNGTSDAILVWGASNTVVAGNYFGVRADGVTDGVGNMAGVGVGDGGSDNRIGGTDPADRNLFTSALSGTGTGWGLVWNGNAASSGNLVQGNEMGFTIGGTPTVSEANGVVVLAGAMTVGGTDPAAANRIRGGWNGVLVADDIGPAVATVLGNRIWGQSDVPIDFDDDGVTPNDPLDADSGPNDLLNHPVITSVDEIGGTSVVAYDLDVPAGTYRIEFFENTLANPNESGPGETLVHVATVTHPGGGVRSFRAAFPANIGAPVVSATASEVIGAGQFGATSEFSNPLVTSPSGSPVVDHSQRRADLDALGGADGATPGAGVVADAVEFDGGAERLVAPTFDLTDAALSVSAWVHLDSVAGDPRLVSRSTEGATILDVFVAGTTAFARLGLGGAPVEVSGGTIAVATWHQVGATWDGATLTLYVDGDPVDTAAATGMPVSDAGAPLVIGNSEQRDHGLDGRIDFVRIEHTARSAASIRTEYLNLTEPGRSVSLGAVETAPPGAWTNSTGIARSGSRALAAPTTAVGAGAWATATGIDEPGLAFESWWYLTDPGTTHVAAGTATGNVPTDQRELGVHFGAVELGTSDGADRSVDATTAASVLPAAWTRLEVRTDELGRSSLLVGGTEVLAPTAQPGGPGRGSAGLRVDQLPAGAALVDDVRIRRYVSDEPVATLGPVHRL